MINAYRPDTLDTFIGNESIKKEINLILHSSKTSNINFPATLLVGPSGTGKSTLARIIAHEMSSKFFNVLGSSVENVDDIRHLIGKLDFRGHDKNGKIIGKIYPDVLFFDEIHRLPKLIQESFYTIMEDRIITISRDNPFSGEKEILSEWTPFMTLVGATTHQGLLFKSFVDRFGLILRMEPYSIKDLTKILLNACSRTKVECEESGLNLIAEYSKTNPRIALSLLDRCKDLMIASNKKILTLEIVGEMFHIMELMEYGLTKLDIKLLIYLAQTYPQKVGIQRLANIVGETKKTLEDLFEPFLLNMGFILSTPSGRTIGEEGIKYLDRHGLLPERNKSTRTITEE